VYPVNILTGSVKWCTYDYDENNRENSRVECD
jgi:hypothetical protein